MDERSGRAPLWIALIVALVLVFGLVIGTAIGGSDAPESLSAEDWADRVCGAVDTWYEDVTNVDDLLAGLGEGSPGPDLRGELDDLEAATRRLADELSDAGLPDTAAAEDAERIVVDLADSLQARLAAVGAMMEEAGGLLDTLRELPTIAEEVADEVEGAVDDVRQATEALRGIEVDAELRRAIDDAPACRTLRATVGG